MSAKRYPDKFWQEVRDCWESKPKMSLTGALDEICKAWNIEKKPSASSATRRQANEMWRKYGRDTAKINAKTLQKAINAGIKNINAIDKQINEVKQKDKAQNCAKTAKTKTSTANTAKNNNSVQKIESKNIENQEDTGLQKEDSELQKQDNVTFHEDGSIEVNRDDQPVPDSPVTAKRLYAKKQALVHKLNTAIVIQETRQINYSVHEYTCENLEALKQVRQAILESEYPEELEMNQSKLRSILNIIDATGTLQKTIESNAKVTAVYWGLNTDDLKDMEEVTKQRNISIEESNKRLEEAKAEMKQQKKEAFLRELEIQQLGDSEFIED